MNRGKFEQHVELILLLMKNGNKGKNVNSYTEALDMRLSDFKDCIRILQNRVGLLVTIDDCGRVWLVGDILKDRGYLK